MLEAISQNLKPIALKTQLQELINNIRPNHEDSKKLAYKKKIQDALHRLDLESLDKNDGAQKLNKLFGVIDFFLTQLARVTPMANGGLALRNRVAKFSDMRIKLSGPNIEEEYQLLINQILPRHEAINVAKELKILEQLHDVFIDPLDTES